MSSVIGSSFSENHNITTIQLLTEFALSTRFYNTCISSSKFHKTTVNTFSSQAGADAEGPFPVLGDVIQNKDETTSECELDDSLESEHKSPKPSAGVSSISKAVCNAPTRSVPKIMDRWVREGNEVSQIEASLAMIYLRKRKLFVKALKISEWLEATKRLEFTESHYAARIDLIARARGITEAEEYLKSIPESFQGELVYRTLLANCVSVTDTKKSEEVFDRMKDLGFYRTCSTFNQMLLLYLKVDIERIPNILSLMEEENVHPSLLTYHILVDVKGLNKDINGMEHIVQTMKSERIEPNLEFKVLLARHYAAAGLRDKAMEVLREVEGDDLGKRRRFCKSLLPIYASIGSEKDVERIWKFCKSKASFDERRSAVEAWGILGRVDEAEGVFEGMMEMVKKPSLKHYASLLKVYDDRKMLSKRKDLMRRMAEHGLQERKEVVSRLISIFAASDEKKTLQ